MRQPAPSHGCHEISGWDRCTNKTCVAAGTADTSLLAPCRALQPRAQHTRAPAARGTNVPKERCTKHGWRGVLLRGTAGLQSTYSPGLPPMRTARPQHNLCQRPQLEERPPGNKSEKDSYIARPSFALYGRRQGSDLLFPLIQREFRSLDI